MYGETAFAFGPDVVQAVYPRMYGETRKQGRPLSKVYGLSPHVRGNLVAMPGMYAGARSIPACTGKPPVRRAWDRACGVYPRMYGETHTPSSHRSTAGGLSPHVRGNPGGLRHAPARVGSIPACTGKPPPWRPRLRTLTVYPRMYGETRSKRGYLSVNSGLSPHVRGNPGLGRCALDRVRSIPACTGKPPRRRRSGAVLAVYPRMYGETSSVKVSGARPWGLSPHVRGNPLSNSKRTGASGSIPACTGKPCSTRRHATANAVYPRMYGETR